MGCGRGMCSGCSVLWDCVVIWAWLVEFMTSSGQGTFKVAVKQYQALEALVEVEAAYQVPYL